MIDSFHKTIDMDPPINSIIGDFTSLDGWLLPSSFSTLYPHLADEIRKVLVGDSSYYLVWRKSVSGDVTCSEAYESLRASHMKKRWGKTLWAHFIQPSRSFLLSSFVLQVTDRGCIG